jgi:hypothetical protein
MGQFFLPLPSPLLFGQRAAKNHPATAVLVPYFLLVLLAIYLLAH